MIIHSSPLLTSAGSETQKMTCFCAVQVRICLHQTYRMISQAEDALPESIREAANLATRFAPNLRSMAESAQTRMLEVAKSDTYNGAHLRVEPDALSYWGGEAGGMCMMRLQYSRAMSTADFSSTTPVYIASGIFEIAREDRSKLSDVLLHTSDIFVAGVRSCHFCLCSQCFRRTCCITERVQNAEK